MIRNVNSLGIWIKTAQAYPLLCSGEQEGSQEQESLYIQHLIIYCTRVDHVPQIFLIFPNIPLTKNIF